MTKLEMVLLFLTCGLSALGLSEVNRLNDRVAEMTMDIATVEQLIVTPSDEYMYLRAAMQSALDDLNSRLVKVENRDVAT